MNNILTADVVIIGGGASGLAAGISLLENKKVNVIITERLDRIGKKILATGNGRCNFSNNNIKITSYHGSVKNIKNIIKNTPSGEEFFREMGILCVNDEQGRMYPRSNSSATVVNALRMRLLQLEAREICQFDVNSIEGEFGNYIISSENKKIRCKSVIIAAGGYAAPSFGTDGSMIRMLKNMGYKTAKICPAIAPIRVSKESIKGLKGVRVKGSICAIHNGNILRKEYGEIQFTENSLSGICVFNLAYLLSEYENNLILRADLAPNMNEKQLEEYLYMIQYQRYDNKLEELLTGMFVKNLAVYLVKKSLGRSLNEPISTIVYSDIKSIIKNIKQLEFKVSGLSSWQNAQVTSGGIHGDCITEELELKNHKGIYLCGEILDVDGDCGGYNLQWAWSSGIYTGKKCAELFEREK